MIMVGYSVLLSCCLGLKLLEKYDQHEKSMLIVICEMFVATNRCKRRVPRVIMRLGINVRGITVAFMSTHNDLQQIGMIYFKAYWHIGKLKEIHLNLSIYLIFATTSSTYYEYIFNTTNIHIYFILKLFLVKNSMNIHLFLSQRSPKKRLKRMVNYLSIQNSVTTFLPVFLPRNSIFIKNPTSLHKKAPKRGIKIFLKKVRMDCIRSKDYSVLY